MLAILHGNEHFTNPVGVREEAQKLVPQPVGSNELLSGAAGLLVAVRKGAQLGVMKQGGREERDAVYAEKGSRKQGAPKRTQENESDIEAPKH
jgi:hypothetical protein